MSYKTINACMAITLSCASVTEARPWYLPVFRDMYPGLAAKKVNCDVCHPRRGQKEWVNHYGDALEREIGQKVKDRERVMEGIWKIEKGRCKSGSWQRRLKAALAPCIDREVVPHKSIIERLLSKSREGLPARHRNR